MIDIHHHILPGVDDGAVDMEMAVAMARLAYDDGIRTIIATPHYNSNWDVHRDRVIEQTEILQKELNRRGIALRLRAGNEVRLENRAFIEHALHEDRICYLDDHKRYVLLEQAWENFYPETASIIERFRQQGTTVIIPHPERHYFFREQPSLLDDLLALGAWTQVSVDSLIGQNGMDAQLYAYSLIDRGFAHTLATDAHNLIRKPNLSTGCDIIEKRAGKEALRVLHDRLAGIAGI